MDIAAISALLSSIKAATEIAKLIKDSDLSLEKAEIKLKFAELISALADAKIQISDIQQEIVEKDIEINGLRAKMEIEASLEWESPYYWRGDGEKKDGPYCQRCHDKDRRLVHLLPEGVGQWHCRGCNQFYTDQNYSDSDPSQAITDYNPYREF